MNMLEAIHDTLADEMARDERVVMLGEDVGHIGGVFRVTDGLFDRFGDQRVFDCPIAESAIVGADGGDVGCGARAGGRDPVRRLHCAGVSPDHPTAGAVAVPVARTLPLPGHDPRAVRQRDSNPRVPRRLGRGALRARTRLEDRGAVHGGRRRGLLASAIRDPDPVLFLEPIPLYRTAHGDVPGADHLVELGTANVVREPGDAVVITWGAMVPVACAAADLIAEQRGATVGVVDLRTLAPLDIDTLVRVTEHCGRVVVVQEAPLTAGFGAEVVASLQDAAFWSLQAPIGRIAGYDVPSPVPAVEDWCRPDAERVARALDTVLDA